MNALQDLSKKTSINSLLNPQEASAFPASVDANPGHHNNQGVIYATSFSNGSSFHLRAASWDSVNEAKRKAENGANGHHHLHPHQHMSSAETYSDSRAPRMSRSRMGDIQPFHIEGPVWQPQQDVATMSYGASVVPPLYSAERTPIGGDYQSHNNYNRSYPDPAMVQAPAQFYQATERASVRLAARGMVTEGPQHHQDIRYNGMPYYPPNGVYHPAVYSQQSQEQSEVVPLASLPAQPRPASSSGSAKRRSPDSEATPAPKAKRTAKPKTGPEGPSKRGYNAQKRSEAAQIVAQNAQLLPTVKYAQVTSEKGKEKGSDVRMQLVSPDVGASEASVSLHPELQFARCMSNRYRNDQFPRCVSCTRRWAGDTCRFQGIRFFLKDSERNMVGISFVETQKADLPTMNFPTRWNVPLRAEHINRTKRAIAKALLPTLRLEREHLKLPELIRRVRESEVRATCDTCMTSIFSSSWMCRLCGREACGECFAQVRELTFDRPGAGQAEIAALQARREKHAHSNPFFLSCTRRNEHQAKDFSPMSRFCKEELGAAIDAMERLLIEVGTEDREHQQGTLNEIGSSKEDGVTVQSGSSNNHENQTRSLLHQDLSASLGHLSQSIPSTSYTPSFQSAAMHTPEPPRYPREPSPHTNAPPHPTQSLPIQTQAIHLNGAAARLTQASTPSSQSQPHTHNAKDTQSSSQFPPSLAPRGLASPPYIPPNLPESIASIPYHEIRRYSNSEFSSVDATNKFARIWALGEPLLVTDVLPQFKIQWTPEYFNEKHGDQNCLILECQTDVNKRVTVGEFFRSFGKYENRTECWKLKDWPPSTDFKSEFPELYADFSQAVPVPDFVRRDGVFNIGSHFPTNTIGPDLGPKMYNSMASTQKAGSKGSTRLHMDMADAINIMTYASPCPDGTLGCAAWDLFRAEDSDRLRSFLRKRFGGGSIQDPIHTQQHYLDEVLRKELYDNWGVKSYRVYQRPGEAVFIPAGCAHQVSNMADCIKVASDYVSPENIERCERLTREFREQNQSKVWKEDVLQLRTMMWFAWLSCCDQEKRVSE